jgi:glycosyltransferase involved in cell wall biosynthesis
LPRADGLPSISIVTPTLNAERYLTECLASLGAQAYPIEHLVVDGGSTDGTHGLVHAAGATWLSRPGLKQSAAINLGLRAARGEIVAWLNADDLYAPGSLRLVAEQFAAEPGLDVLYGDCQVIGADGRLLWRERPGPYDFRRLRTRGNFLAQPAVFLRKRAFEQVGYLDESLEFGMDYDLWLRLRPLRVAYVPRVLAAFRWHPASKTATNALGNWHELLLIVRRYGGGWTLPLIWAYARMRVSAARLRTAQVLSEGRRHL